MSGELPEGMKPWDGGDAAPADYDGGKVLSRSHGLQYPDRLNGNRWGRERTHPFFHEDEESCDIIAYTPMNPHQKPQEDVVGLLPCPNPWCNSQGRERPQPFVRYYESSCRYRVNCDICPQIGPSGETAEEARTAWNTRATPTYEAGRRDMREAAARMCAQVSGLIGASTGSSIHSALREAENEIRGIPTEPLGGEGSPDNSGPE